MTPRAVLAQHSATFARAASFLPPRARDDVAVVYALCRHIDDLADDAVEPRIAARALDQLDAELAGKSEASEIVAGFLEVATRREIPVAEMRHLLRGCRGDVGSVRIEDDEALLDYADSVAGTVGRMCAPLLGAGPESAAAAGDLGVAMQLTNICRDVAEDAERGRVYLPAVRLLAAGTDAEALVAGEADKAAVSRVVRDLLDLADAYYVRGRWGFGHLPVRTRIGVAVAARLYQGIGGVLRRRGGDALAGRAVVGRARKAWLVVRGLLDVPVYAGRRDRALEAHPPGRADSPRSAP